MDNVTVVTTKANDYVEALAIIADLQRHLTFNGEIGHRVDCNRYAGVKGNCKCGWLKLKARIVGYDVLEVRHGKG